MSGPTLRGLAKAYADQIVDRKRYIRERRRLIDEIVAGKVELIPYRHPVPRTVPDLDRTFSDGETTIELPHIDHLDDANTTNEKSTRGLMITCIVSLAAVVLGAWFYYRAAPQIEMAEQLPVIDKPRDAPLSINPKLEILTKFIEQNRWENEHIVEFQAQWIAGDSAERISATETSSVRRAIDLIVQKYLEENALSTLGSSREPLIKQRHLLDLGFALSPDNERIKRLDSEWHIANEELEKNAQSADPKITADSSDLDFESAEPTLALEEPLGPTTEIPLQNDSLDDGAFSLESAVTRPAAQNPESAAPDRNIEIESRTDGPEHLTAATNVDAVPEAAEVKIPVNSKGSDESELANTAQNALPATGKSTTATKKTLACRASLAKERRPYCRDSIAEDALGPELTVLPSGTFNMGGSRREEQPLRVITIGQPFAVSIFEISYREFEQFCTSTAIPCPTQPWSDPNLPMVNVSWEMASEYTEWLSNKTGAKYRLPTESEWEYAARAGTTTVYPFGDEILPTHARFSFRAIASSPLANDNRAINRNNFRLYHMVGNVQEWVEDGWENSYVNAPSDSQARRGNSHERVVRGGSYLDGPDKVRSAYRTFLAADASNAATGFRIVREVE